RTRTGRRDEGAARRAGRTRHGWPVRRRGLVVVPHHRTAPTVRSGAAGTQPARLGIAGPANAPAGGAAPFPRVRRRTRRGGRHGAGSGSTDTGTGARGTRTVLRRCSRPALRAVPGGRGAGTL